MATKNQIEFFDDVTKSVTGFDIERQSVNIYALFELEFCKARYLPGTYMSHKFTYFF